jgi:DNA-binding CsgD family transcriptional regulator
MTTAASTARQIPIAHSSAAVLDSRPPLVPHHEARCSPEPVTRLAAQALSSVAGIVPCDLALFRSITPRMEVRDGLILERAAQSRETPIDPGFQHTHGPLDDPFAPIVAARRSASLLTVEDAGGARSLANSAYGRRLHGAGLEHQVTLYLRIAGALTGMIALFRALGARPFDRSEIRVLRQLQPLIEHAHACSAGPSAAPEPSPTLPTLTRREAEVAALIALGASNAEIATALNVERATVKTHLTQIYAKFGVRSRIQLALRLNAETLAAPD